MRTHFINRLKKNNLGSAFLMVIIGVSFLAVIGIVVLSLASNYIVSTSVNSHSTSNFYDAEAILEEVRSGVVEKASSSAEKAYNYCIERYDQLGADREKKFKEVYFNELMKALSGVAYDWDSATWVSDVSTRTTTWTEIKKFTKTPNAIQDPGNCTIKIDRSGTEPILTIRKLKIEYTSTAGYSTKISTDINIKMPDYHLGGDSTMNQIKKYIVVSDDKMDVSLPSLNLKGNIYTGPGGINMTTTTASAQFLSDMIISRGDLSLLGGAKLTLANHAGTDKSNVWVENIETKAGMEDSTLVPKLDVNANCFVSDDLNLNANCSDVKFQGNYYGYNYNHENAATSTVFNDKFSSAIIINGLQTKLNMTNVTQLLLAGRSFIERKDSTYSSQVSDIQMGESLGIKNHQVAYFVPDDCIAVKRNPMFQSEYEAVSEDAAVNVSMLLDSTHGLSNYLNLTAPYTKNFIQTPTGSYVYFFLNFKSSTAANEYFKEHYLANTAKLYDKSVPYIAILDSSKNITFTLSPTLCLLAGNIVNDFDNAGGSSLLEANYYNASNEPKASLLSEGRNLAQQYYGYQTSLLSSSNGTFRFAGDDKKTSPLVTSKVLNSSEVSAQVGNVYSYSSVPDGSVTVLGSGGTINGSVQNGIVIADGDVTVSSNFKGLIISKGAVKVTGASQMTADSVLVRKLLDEVAKDAQAKKLFIDVTGRASSEVVDLSKYIYYKNWSKNAD